MVFVLLLLGLNTSANFFHSLEMAHATDSFNQITIKLIHEAEVLYKADELLKITVSVVGLVC